MNARNYCHGQAMLDRAADGKDYPEHYDLHARIATRGEGSDDNGEPLCSEDANPTAQDGKSPVAVAREVHGDPWPKMPSLSATRETIRLPRTIEQVLANNPHHLDTET